jgi:hypothetical protein
MHSTFDKSNPIGLARFLIRIIREIRVVDSAREIHRVRVRVG